MVHPPRLQRQSDLNRCLTAIECPSWSRCLATNHSPVANSRSNAIRSSIGLGSLKRHRPILFRTRRSLPVRTQPDSYRREDLPIMSIQSRRRQPRKRLAEANDQPRSRPASEASAIRQSPRPHHRTGRFRPQGSFAVGSSLASRTALASRTERIPLGAESSRPDPTPT